MSNGSHRTKEKTNVVALVWREVVTDGTRSGHRALARGHRWQIHDAL